MTIQKLQIRVYTQRYLTKMLFIIVEPGERIQMPNCTVIEKQVVVVAI